MKNPISVSRTGLFAVAMGLLAAGPLSAQQGVGRIQSSSLFADLEEDIAVLKNKLMSLAEAIPEADYTWRPGDGVRSVHETLMHVAAENYFIPMAMGAQPPEQIPISDFASAQAFETREGSKQEVLDELDASFVHLRRVLEQSDPATTGDEIILFGMSSTVQKAWILTTTHLHEHLGQMIAYARVHGVVPPWSM